MVLLTFLSACSTLPGMNEDELTSVIYHMKATVPGHSKTVTAERTDKGYLLTYHKEDMEHPEKIEIDEADFKKLENWLLRMKKQGRKKKTDGDGSGRRSEADRGREARR